MSLKVESSRCYEAVARSAVSTYEFVEIPSATNLFREYDAKLTLHECFAFDVDSSRIKFALFDAQ